jgi:hypothetical protein
MAGNPTITSITCQSGKVITRVESFSAVDILKPLRAGQLELSGNAVA